MDVGAPNVDTPSPKSSSPSGVRVLLECRRFGKVFSLMRRPRQCPQSRMFVHGLLADRRNTNTNTAFFMSALVATIASDIARCSLWRNRH